MINILETFMNVLICCSQLGYVQITTLVVVVSLWHHCSVHDVQVTFFIAFSMSVLFGLKSLIFLCTWVISEGQ